MNWTVWKIAVVLAVSVGVAPSAIAQNAAGDSAPASSAQSTAKATKIRSLIETLYPFENMVASNLKTWEIAVRDRIMRQNGAALEAQYPGIIQASIVATKPTAREYMQFFVTSSVQIKSNALDALTEAEIDDLLAFYKSGAGQRFRAKTIGSFDVESFATRTIKNVGDAERPILTPATVASEEQKMLRAALATTSGADQIEMMRFEAKPVARRFAEASRASDVQILQLANNPDPAKAAKLQSTLQAAMIAFADAHDKKK